METMKHMPQIKSVMTPFPYSVDIGAPIGEARDFLRSKKIRHLPVMEDRKLVGMVSDRDIKLMLGPDFAYPSEDELRVRDVMIKEAYTVSLSEPLDAVLEHMAEHHLGSVLVTKKGKLVGVFTATDACRAFAKSLRKQFPPPDGGQAA